MSLDFDEDFDTVPPIIHFNTIPFHPNGNTQYIVFVDLCGK